VVRVPHRRARRAEVRALTGQLIVPVAVLDGEAICDSRRIVEHLEYLDVVPKHVVHPGLPGGWWLSKPQLQGRTQMNLHGNARTCPRSRRLIVQRVSVEGWTVAAAAQAAGVSARTAAKWLARYRSEGEAGLLDRSSAPRSIPHRTPVERVRAIELLRRLRMTAAEIAETLAMPLATVSAVLKRIGLGKRSRLEPPEPANRYECAFPGELVHIDVKKLARFNRPGHRVLGRGPGRFDNGAGYEYVHVCVDDYSRLAYVEVLTNQRAATAVGFLRRALAWYRAHGIEIQRLMTDNGAAYISHAHRAACNELGLRHSRIRPRRPRTNGKAERFIQTLVNSWAYARLYQTNNERTQALPLWLDHYNYTRPHGSLGHQPPSSRLNNLARNYN
jgi:transposase InsO family protein